MITRDFSVISMTSQASLSLSLLLTKVTHAQYRKRFRASYNTSVGNEFGSSEVWQDSLCCLFYISPIRRRSSVMERRLLAKPRETKPMEKLATSSARKMNGIGNLSVEPNNFQEVNEKLSISWFTANRPFSKLLSGCETGQRFGC